MPISRVIRRVFLVFVPGVTAVLLGLHPPETGSAFDLRGSTDRWLIVHVGLLVMIPLVAMVLWMLLGGIDGRAATVSRVMLVPFVAFYAAFESMVGIGTGVLINETDALPAVARPGAEALTERWWEVPMPVPLIATAAILSWVVAVGSAAVAHARARSPLLVVIGLAAATVFFALGHPGITGVLGMVGLLIAAAAVAFGPSARERGDVGADTR